MNDTPYVPFNPGDLIVAESMNEMQMLIKGHIRDHVSAEIANHQTVNLAKNALALNGKDETALTQAILEAVMAQLAQQTRYHMAFLHLKKDQTALVKHDLGSFPLIDVYQLDYFQVVSSENGHEDAPYVNFFIYHSSERTLRHPETKDRIHIEEQPRYAYRFSFEDMLERMNVSYTPSSSLDDVRTEFWEKFENPEYGFWDDQHTHSPWFDKCCHDRKTVKMLKDQNDWDNIMFKMVPRKTTTMRAFGATVTDGLEIAHFNFDTIGITLREAVKYPGNITDIDQEKQQLNHDLENEINVMLLLKV